MSAFTTAIRQRLGVPDPNASATTLLAALDEALAEVRDDVRDARPAPVAVKPSAKPGEIIVSAAEHAQLVADATAGHDARAQLISGRRDQIVDEAIRSGRIVPAARAQWRASADVDESGVRELLNTFSPNTVPLSEIGHSDTISNSQDALYAAAFGDDTKE